MVGGIILTDSHRLDIENSSMSVIFLYDSYNLIILNVNYNLIVLMTVTTF